MPAQPDNSKIEELLKAYAKKRREEMGAPVELHPATRKMLQAEVERQRPAPAPERRSIFSLLLQFWPRSAMAGAAVVFLSLVLVNINQQPNPSEATKMAQASKEREQAGRSSPESRPAAPPINSP